jgi:phage major head subunit gpT-like protein
MLQCNRKGAAKMMKRTAIVSAILAGIVLILIFGLLFFGSKPSVNVSAIATGLTAVRNIIAIAVSDMSEMPWLVLVCAGAGVMVIADRRRRAKVRQATS